MVLIGSGDPAQVSDELLGLLRSRAVWAVWCWLGLVTECRWVLPLECGGVLPCWTAGPWASCALGSDLGSEV